MSGLGNTVEDLGTVLRTLVSQYMIKEVPKRERAADKLLQGYIFSGVTDDDDDDEAEPTALPADDTGASKAVTETGA